MLAERKISKSRNLNFSKKIPDFMNIIQIYGIFYEKICSLQKICDRNISFSNIL